MGIAGCKGQGVYEEYIRGVCDVIGLGVFSRGLASETTVDPQNTRIILLRPPTRYSQNLGNPKPYKQIPKPKTSHPKS